MGGVFITFEGPEGSGKTTQIQALYEYLRSQGYQVLLTREPGGTAIGDQIRAVLLAPGNREMGPQAEVLLFSAARAQLVDQVIRPQLERGTVVISDRYADSTMAYQGHGLGLDLDVLRTITAFATGGLRPDLIIYLDIPVEEGLRRKRTAYRHGQGEWNRLDQKDLNYYQRVRTAYLTMAAQDRHRWLVVDATASMDEIQRVIRGQVDQLLRREGDETDNEHCQQR